MIKRLILFALIFCPYLSAQTKDRKLSLNSYLSNPLGISMSDESYVLLDFTREFGVPDKIETINILTHEGYIPGQRLYWGSIIADISTNFSDSGTVYYFQVLDSSINLGSDLKVNMSIGAPFDTLHESLLNRFNVRFMITGDKLKIDDQGFSIVISSERGMINSISWSF